MVNVWCTQLLECQSILASTLSVFALFHCTISCIRLLIDSGVTFSCDRFASSWVRGLSKNRPSPCYWLPKTYGHWHAKRQHSAHEHLKELSNKGFAIRVCCRGDSALAIVLSGGYADDDDTGTELWWACSNRLVLIKWQDRLEMICRGSPSRAWA